MALAGDAIVAIWNDVTADGLENFYEWHNREHMDERVGIDGFLRGRRYAAIPGPLAGVPEYFTLYEVLNADVLAGTAYRTRLNAPSSWTTRSVADFRNVARSLCRLDVSLGNASGGYLGTLRFDCDAAHDAALMQRLRAILADLSKAVGIVAVHVGRADVSASTTRTAEQEGRPDNAVPRWVVLIEASTQDAVAAAFGEHLGETALAEFALTGAVRGIYSLQFDMLKPS